MPCGRVILACSQLRCVVRAEDDVEAAGAELGIVGAVGARSDATESRCPAAASLATETSGGGAGAWRGKKQRIWRVEKKKRRGAWKFSWRLEFAGAVAL
jgi:hypothetical protein